MGRDRLGPITPLPINARELRGLHAVLLFGGSFDPPHTAHVAAGEMARDRLYGDRGWLLFVPAARSPSKRVDSGTSAQSRLRMLCLATASVIQLNGATRCSVWADEIDRAKLSAARADATPSYTIDTVRRLRTLLPSRIAIRLVVGSDQAAEFHRWRQPRNLLTLARPLVLLREPIDTPAALWTAMSRSRFWSTDELRTWCECVAPVPLMANSSTALRGAIERRRLSQAVRLGLSPSVAAYIRNEGLYGVRRSKARAKP
ncbi:MAG: nicotinate-nicotinamide nucleotide adenylyltransferase [Phycisphaeraceae bacterium]|nr:nicotinate-nicotinamide nucleotide adenylyltransferase [Phycisphaeraceae bacterium]